ncbi:CLUMA_CG003554, isoform A [Clunio marinus]|uniref:CLUMA_CG003554, isoform A n=1 Tax=Clunio marinus TaxID=568069 RepID=A0A1J1HQN0_9DIPT|nr:CLUMA_CG003554, isoform A [Clunio marinus]
MTQKKSCHYFESFSRSKSSKRADPQVIYLVELRHEMRPVNIIERHHHMPRYKFSADVQCDEKFVCSLYIIAVLFVVMKDVEEKFRIEEIYFYESFNVLSAPRGKMEKEKVMRKFRLCADDTQDEEFY